MRVVGRNLKEWLYPFCTLIVLLMLVSSCSDEQEDLRKEEWVHEEAKKKAERFRQDILVECQLEILKEAERYVDSLIAVNDLLSEIIDETIPDRPEKPLFIGLDSAALLDHRVNPVLKN